jgi:D-beta-D-heptose 7-phosphate kinase / D-beta-D-heptose 1-phosphate adenosyltransferase
MLENLHQLIQLITGDWRRTSVLVVGDVMLDRYVWGNVERISPEAPVPIVKSTKHNERPGGAANVAMNIAGLGGRAQLFGFCGDDPEQRMLERALMESGIESHLIRVESRPTTSKMRILSGNQQIVRLDTESTAEYPAAAYDSLISEAEAAMSRADVIILSDYAKGVLSEDACQRLIQAGRRKGIPVLVDPKHRNLMRYRGATTICPNRSELALATGINVEPIDELLAAAQKLLAQLEIDYLTVTLSEKGIAVVQVGSIFIAPAVARQVFDVSGAGDTVIATLALAISNGLAIDTSVKVANLAAGIVVGKVGTVPVHREELLNSLTPEIDLLPDEKVLQLDALRFRVAAWRSSGESIVFTNGCFDLLHMGHVTLLQDARREGNRLIVAINSDASVRKLKGPARPIVGEYDRARILAALSAVDAVVIFGESTPLQLIKILRPDVIVKGGDYREEAVVGASEVRSWNGRVKIVPTLQGFSTTSLIAKANAPTGEQP